MTKRKKMQKNPELFIMMLITIIIAIATILGLAYLSYETIMSWYGHVPSLKELPSISAIVAGFLTAGCCIYLLVRVYSPRWMDERIAAKDDKKESSKSKEKCRWGMVSAETGEIKKRCLEVLTLQKQFIDARSTLNEKQLEKLSNSAIDTSPEKTAMEQAEKEFREAYNQLKVVEKDARKIFKHFDFDY